MNCDICGREIVGQPFRVMVEGAKMLVCRHCQKLGEPYKEAPVPPRSVTAARLVPLPPGVLPRKAPELPREMGEFDLAEDIAERVRKYRAKLGISQDELAKLVKEKLSVIQKIETGKMTPDTKLCRELEHVLRVKLLVPHAEAEALPKTKAPASVTLGDIVRVKEKSKSAG